MNSKMNSTTSKMNPVAEQLHKINEYRMRLVKHLAPSASDYGFGGGHRMWIIDSAIKTADAYIADVEQMSKGITEALGKNTVIIVPYKMAIPMPPMWEGVRPADIAETYGHPHTKGKDWRHFENTLRWRFADKGYICDCSDMNNNEGIVFVAQKMIACVYGMPKIDEKMKKDNTYSHTATQSDYNEYCEMIEKEFEGTKIAKQRAITEQYPYALRPMVAISISDPADTEED
jgi:hypothetical protein